MAAHLTSAARGIVIAATLLCVICGSAQTGLVDLQPFREGCQALADERYESAASHFADTWEILDTEEAGEIEKNLVTARLLQALVKNGEARRAIQWHRDHSLLQPSPETTFWLAHALKNEERFAEAAETFRALATSSPERSESISVDHAFCLARSGDSSTAFGLIKDFSPSSPAEAIICARVAFEAREYDSTIAFLGGAGTGTEPTAELLRMRALDALGQEAEAITTAIDFIDNTDEEKWLRYAFATLEEIGPPREDPALQKKLAEWRQESSTFRGQAAEYFEIVSDSSGSSLASELNKFLTDNPSHPFAADASLRIADLTGQFDPTPPSRESPREGIGERMKFAAAKNDYQAGLFEEASGKFLDLAANQNGREESLNLYNGAVSALKANDETTFQQISKKLSETDPRSDLLADLEYLGGLYFAANGNPEAFEILNSFVRDHPDHPANIEAQLALAEIHLNQVPARPQAARKIFEGLRLRPLTLNQSERLDYSAVWTELIDHDGNALIELGNSFITDWPNSDYLPEVMMIVATKLYEVGNLEAARDQFRRIAENFPDSPNARLAEFFAIRSSPPNSETTSKWKKLVEENSALSISALHELGRLYLSLDQFDAAREIFSALTDSDHVAPELQYAAQADLGFSYYAEALASQNDPTLFGKAADVFAKLSSTPDAPVAWRYNAAVRRGRCLEAMDNPTVALEIYESIVNDGNIPAPTTTSVAEAEWISRAGFSAIDILRKQEDWPAAIKLADALALKEGPRAIEAARLAEQLRLKHWVWD